MSLLQATATAFTSKTNLAVLEDMYRTFRGKGGGGGGGGPMACSQTYPASDLLNSQHTQKPKRCTFTK